jgi:hypothetical protein
MRALGKDHSLSVNTGQALTHTRPVDGPPSPWEHNDSEALSLRYRLFLFFFFLHYAFSASYALLAIHTARYNSITCIVYPIQLYCSKWNAWPNVHIPSMNTSAINPMNDTAIRSNNFFITFNFIM